MALNLNQLTYHPLERLTVARPVSRIDYIRARCKGLRVLDLGAYDETEVEKPQHQCWRWLHAEIAAVATEVLGVDASPKLRAIGDVTTRAGSRIVYGTVEDLGQLVRDFRPDLVVAGELIEHTQDTLGWLTTLGNSRPGVRLLASTPNATSVINLGLAFLRRENNHPDHLHIYSFKTLATLSRRLHMTDVSIRPYYYDSQLFQGRVSKFLGPAVTATNLMILRPMQFFFPLTAFGLIWEGALPGMADL